ncbi:MAG: ion channel, partial [Aeoliella sp.]
MQLVAPQLRPTATQISLGFIFAWLTISAVYAVSNRRQAPLVAVVLGVLLLGAELADLSLQRTDTHVASHILGILFMGHIVLVLLGFIFHQTRVCTETVFASLCIYLLLGFIWAFVYSLLERIQPGAFSYSQVEVQNMRFGAEGSLAVYFSFVTMTTLGYGDI